MKRTVAFLTLVAALAAPATGSAFHHVLVPANTCGVSPSAGGNNPTATAQVRDHSQANDGNLPIPPAGTPAVANSPVIGPGAPCPAPQK